MKTVVYKLEVIGKTIQLRAYGARFDLGYTVLEHLPYPCKASSLDLLRKDGTKAAKRMKTTFVDMTA